MTEKSLAQVDASKDASGTMGPQSPLAISPSHGADELADLKRPDLSGNDVDEGEIFLREHDFNSEYLQQLLADQTEVKKLMRRVDLRLLPLLCFTVR